jgi:DNA-binding transcriptional regulator YiaG
MPRRAELIAEMYRDLKSARARELREAAGLSQTETAEIIGTTSATLRRWEAGECQPRGELGYRYGLLLYSWREREGRSGG